MEDNIALFFWGLNNTIVFSIFKIISSKIYIIITSGIFIIYAVIKLKKQSIQFLITLIISVSASDVICYRLLKPAIMRERPKVELKISSRSIETTRNYTMPSNHASNTFAFFIAYFLLIKRYWQILLANSLLISFSRIVLVKHYPTDVMVGIATGIIIGLCTVYLISLIYKRKGIYDL
ncbi:MAG: phosphatase PAP2 family protein [Spirochaetota bacterium]|nr:phosphatase PAP2 family protein [Spirochaetota bacterium]